MTTDSKASIAQQLKTPRAYKRSPALTNLLMGHITAMADNRRAFDLTIAKIRRGTEPPPHVHSREDEFFYILSGEIRFYVDREVFTVTTGECMFLPQRRPHAFLITSEEIHIIALITPEGFNDALNKMNAPTGRMEGSTEVDAETCCEHRSHRRIEGFGQYGVRLLTADETRTEMPQYPIYAHLGCRVPERLGAYLRSRPRYDPSGSAMR